jgi:hypothetical protein
MKKISLSIALIIVGFSFATENPTIKPKNESKSTEIIVDTHFNLNYKESNKTLKIDISGNLDSTASVSVTNQRGSSILFSLVGKNEQEIEFNLASLEKGSYNVMFISKNEIRIKKFEVK